MPTSSELLDDTSPATEPPLWSPPGGTGAPMSREWWQDPRQDMDASERPCGVCRGRGVDRWGEDCPECGGLGVLFR